MSVANVQDVHAHHLAKATALSGFHDMKQFLSPYEVIAVLNTAGVSFVLVGAYGLGGWMNKTRATEDVDVIVATKHHKKAVRLLLAEFTDLEEDDQPVVTRLRHVDTKAVAVDIMKPNQQLFRVAFKHTHTISAKGHTYRIPTLEMALAMKFAPMVSIHRRDADKLQDAHDFIYMVNSNPVIDLTTLGDLGDLVYPGGGKELVDFVSRVRRGEKLYL